MFKSIKSRKNKKKGFTLIELIIVIAILGILAAILVPSMINVIGDANDKVNAANARTAYSAAQTAYVSIAAGGAATDAGTYNSGTLFEATKTNLGGVDVTKLTSIVVGSNGITSVTYGGVTYPAAAPAATATPAT